MADESIDRSMSTPSSKAAEIAARQVEQIVEAAQLAADRLQVDAEKELADRRREIEKEGERIREEARAEVEKVLADARAEAHRIVSESKGVRSEAKAEAAKVLDEARVEALKLTEDSRKQAAERVQAAEQAADEALRDAEAVSAGLRRLGSTLERQAQEILREVQAGHRQVRAELRIASGAGPGGGSALPAREPAADSGGSSRRRGARSGDNPFEDIDLPSWVGPE